MKQVNEKQVKALLREMFQVSHFPSSGCRDQSFSVALQRKENRLIEKRGRTVEYSLCKSLSPPCPVAKGFVDFSLVACLKSFAGPLTASEGGAFQIWLCLVLITLLSREWGCRNGNFF